LAIATVLNVTVFFVFAEAAPKTWAIQHTNRAALLAAGPVRFLADFPLLRWLSRGLLGITNVILPGKGLPRGPFLSELELLAVADQAVEEEVIEAEERDLIESIIEFGDTVVREVMVPRPDMVTVRAEFRVEDVLEIVLLNGYSRLPVCGESIDDIVGLVYAKDLMRAQRDGKDHLQVRELQRTARFVPETKRVPALLADMQREKFHMAIVVDEYGGTAGLVTLEDLIEELVGEIVDEFDVEDPNVEPLPGGDVRINARMPVDEVNDLLHARLPEGDWDSIGGLLLSELGHVPSEGEAIVVDGWQLTAERVQGRRIARVRISRLPTAVGSAGGEAAS
jgi:CBS domain containing-hemolysin-like protein